MRGEKVINTRIACFVTEITYINFLSQNGILHPVYSSGLKKLTCHMTGDCLCVHVQSSSLSHIFKMLGTANPVILRFSAEIRIIPRFIARSATRTASIAPIFTQA
jgi:hypothetical protein